MTTMLAAYNEFCSRLAEASRIDEVMELHDALDHVKLYARKVKDRALLAEAAVYQVRADRKLGMLLAQVREAGQLCDGKGRPAKASDATQSPATLTEIGVDRKWAARAQATAKLDAEAFGALEQDTRDRIRAGKAVTVDDVAGSRAIMNSRHEPDDSLDYFPTPPWATRALIEWVLPQVGRRGDCPRQTAWEPACGEGHIAEVLGEYFRAVLATDIHDYGYGHFRDRNFLDVKTLVGGSIDWIITNPPFGDVGEAFVLNAIALAGTGVAMFMRVQWLDTIGRYERIFRDQPPTLIAFFAERVPLCKGRWDPDGDTATAYMWLVWIKGAAPRAPFWIPPGQRKALTMPDDVARFTARPVTKRPSTADAQAKEQAPCS